MEGPDMLPISVSDWQGATSGELTAHSKAAEIIRQVDFYFGDENLPGDPHLLGLTGGDGNGPVSLSQICSWRKMRQFRPLSQVREALRDSEIVEVIDGKKGGHIKRKHPLTKRITVIPKINEERARVAAMAANPALTKNMLKPTGLEPNATEGPITPEQYEIERSKYDPNISFTSRIEDAVNAFADSRKWHQGPAKIFSRFMIFGGLEPNSHMFQGIPNKKELKREGLDKEEILQMTAQYGIAHQVLDAMYAVEDEGDEPTWVVDFERIARAFLSSDFIDQFDWYSKDEVVKATEVLRKFYNYLVVHDVCPEYNDQLLAARDVCDLADEELPKLATVDHALPGSFNAACSTLFGGSLSSLKGCSQWDNDATNTMSDDEALIILKMGIAAHGTDEQYRAAKAIMDGGSTLKVVSEETLGLEIVSTELPTGDAKALYDTATAHYRAFVKPMGKLHCKRWSIPFAPPQDLPSHTTENKQPTTYDFILEEETLKDCVLGMKFEAVVKELEIGIKWIDSVDAVFPSFHTWLPNERIRDWKQPGPPKAWMRRQHGLEEGVDGGKLATIGEEGENDEELD